MVSSTTCGDSFTSPFNPVNFANAFPQRDQSSSAHQNKAATVPFSQSFAPVNTTTVDLIMEPHETHPVNSVPSIADLFQVTSDSSASTGKLVSTHTSLSSMRFFEENSQNSKDMNLGATHSEPAPNNLVSTHTSLSSLSFFEESPQNSSAMNIGAAHSESAPNNLVSSHTSSVPSLSFLEENPGSAHSDSVPDNVGWATFDSPQHASTSKSHDFVAVAEQSGTGASVGKFNTLSASHGNTKWPDFLSSTAHGALPLISNPQHENLPYNPALAIAPNNQREWRPFDEMDKQQGGVGHLIPDNPSTADHYLGSTESEDFSKGRSQNTTSFGPVPGLHVSDELSSVDQSAVTFMGELHSHFERTTSNPFDIPYDAELDPSNMHFYDMSTLQAALPSTDFPSSFAGAINDSWFLQDAANPCLAAPPPGGISYMAAQTPGSQLPNVQTHGPVASIGGNPFA